MIDDSISNPSLFMVYQPALTISAEGYRVSACEALVRVAPNRIGLHTGTLISQAEADGTMPDLDLRIAGLVSQDSMIRPDLNIWMNLSQLTLSKPASVELIAQSLEQIRCNTEITIEMTESVSGHQKQILSSLSILKNRCIKIVIDDIEDGVASTNLLPSEFISGCKLSRLSTMRMVNDASHRNRIGKLVRWCHDNGKTVVVEGIENPTELRMAEDLGAHFYQGYYFSRPAHIESLPMQGAILKS